MKVIFNNIQKTQTVGGGAIIANNKKTNNSSNNFDYNKSFHPGEVLGKSAVNFSGKKFQLNDDDKLFVNVVAFNLRLSEEQEKQLGKIVSKHLKENKLKSMDEMLDFNGLCKNIKNKLNLSDIDSNMLAQHIAERVYPEDGQYNPMLDRYEKDFEVVDYILEKYEFDDVEEENLFQIMIDEAKEHGAETVFDIFKPENRLNVSQTFEYLNDTYPSEKALDIYLDFVDMSSKDEKTRHSFVNKTKISDAFYNQQKNNAIFDLMSEKFGFGEGFQEEIITEIDKRNTENKNISQIAFELADKYNLPSGAEETIEDFILNSDDMVQLLKNEGFL